MVTFHTTTPLHVTMGRDCLFAKQGISQHGSAISRHRYSNQVNESVIHSCES